MTRSPASPPPQRQSRRAPGFTIVELLVVIGIITVLMAILVPVISRARVAAQTAATLSQIQRITAGINNYFQDFNAYPGVLSNSTFAKGTPGSFIQGMGTTYTQSEDMALALLGGLTYPTSGTLIKYDPQFVGTGPVTFNLNNPSKRQPYLQKIPAELPQDLNAALSAQNPTYPHLAGIADSLAPEFLDLYNEPRPLIYVRAQPGAAATSILYDSSTAGSFNATYSYDFREVKPYLRPITGDAKLDDVLSKGAADASVQAQFTAVAGTVAGARGAGSYILIGAGPDRLFGTNDDQVFTGGGGK